jgi:hypothetical protein
MSNPNYFPTNYDGVEHKGVTLRDQLALTAMHAMLTNPSNDKYTSDKIAKYAYDIADEMLHAREHV